MSSSADSTFGFVMSYGRRIGARLFVANAIQIVRPVESRLRCRPSCEATACGFVPSRAMRASSASRSRPCRGGRHTCERAPARPRRRAARAHRHARSARAERPSARSAWPRARSGRARSCASRRRRAEAGANMPSGPPWRRRYGIMPPTFNAADRHAEGDGRGAGRRPEARSGSAPSGAESTSEVTSPGQAAGGARTRFRGEPKRLRSRGGRTRRAGVRRTGGRQPSRFQCRREYQRIIRDHCVDSASTTRASTSGSSTVHVTTAAPRACASRTLDLVTTSDAGRRRAPESPKQAPERGGVTRCNVRSARRPSGAPRP